MTNLGRPPRTYNEEVLDVVRKSSQEIRRLERTFLQDIEEAKAAGVPLRTLEGITGISRTSLARGPAAHWIPED